MWCRREHQIVRRHRGHWGETGVSVAGVLVMLALAGVGNKVTGAVWLVAMRGKALLLLADGGVVNLSEATGLTAGAAPTTGLACWAASFCLASGDRA